MFFFSSTPRVTWLFIETRKDRCTRCCSLSFSSIVALCPSLLVSFPLSTLPLAHAYTKKKKNALLATRKKKRKAPQNMISDLLDFSKLEVGQLALRRAPFEPYHLMRSCVELFEKRAAHEGVELTLVHHRNVERDGRCLWFCRICFSSFLPFLLCVPSFCFFLIFFFCSVVPWLTCRALLGTMTVPPPAWHPLGSPCPRCPFLAVGTAAAGG